MQPPAHTALVTLEPISEYFDADADPPSVGADQTYRLSRFAYMRQDGENTVVECSTAFARLVVHSAAAAAAFQALGSGRTLRELEEQIEGLAADDAQALLEAFLHAGIVEPVAPDGATPESRDRALRSWEFHDLLFHTRSRAGRHANPTGGTYRFLTEFAAPPPTKPVAYDETVPLPRPDFDRMVAHDPPLTIVQEERQSIRDYAETPLSLEQLGEFLFRVARVVDYWHHTHYIGGEKKLSQVAQRPYPSGGALYEQEFYVLVNRCGGLESGLYHYDPERHQLGRCCGRTADVERLIERMAWASNTSAETRQVGIILTARFQRLAWKYASIAYALMLKHAGVVYQTMYLVATAMGLAPCGIGNGNSDLFARAAGIDYYEESSIGEFMLGSKPPEV